jgi:hypothetical protein
MSLPVRNDAARISTSPTELGRVQMSSSVKQDRVMSQEHVLQLCRYLLATVLIIVIAHASFRRLDFLGWIAHDEPIDVYDLENWQVGESRDCRSYPPDPELLRRASRSTALSAIDPPFCYVDNDVDDGPLPAVENTNVTFWGRTDQPEYEWIVWHCTRNRSRFVCRQTANSQPVLRGTDRSTGRRVKSYDGGKSWHWADL